MFFAERGTRPRRADGLARKSSVVGGIERILKRPARPPTTDTGTTAISRCDQPSCPPRPFRIHSSQPPSPFSARLAMVGGGPVTVETGPPPSPALGSATQGVLAALTPRTPGTRVPRVVDPRGLLLHGAQRVDAAVAEALVVAGEADVDGAVLQVGLDLPRATSSRRRPSPACRTGSRSAPRRRRCAGTPSTCPRCTHSRPESSTAPCPSRHR